MVAEQGGVVGVILDDRVPRLLVLLRPADGDDHARVGDDRPDADLLAEVEHRPVLRDGQPATGRKREREVRLLDLLEPLPRQEPGRRPAPVADREPLRPGPGLQRASHPRHLGLSPTATKTAAVLNTIVSRRPGHHPKRRGAVPLAKEVQSAS